MSATDDESSERQYIIGSRAALTRMLQHCVGELGYKDGPTREQLIIQREQTVSALRQICGEFGDNDWPDNLHLADVIEKHLQRHLEKP